MKSSDYVASFLRAQGVTHVFEVVGGMITHLLDSIHRAGDIRLVSMHHEQGAGFAAEGFARMTGVPGVAMATMGAPTQGWFVAPPLYYAGGMLVAFYVLSLTYSAPRIGVANAVFFVLVGQIIAAGLIDQFGLFGAMKSPLNGTRLFGIALMLVGTYFARRMA